MPKGSKKRKAAKKKEKIQSSSASTPTHDDVKNQEGKDSDVGEVSSPSQQKNSVSAGGNEGSVVKIERDFKVEGESNDKDGKVEHDEGRKSYDGGSSSSSSGSSSSSSDGDDEEEEEEPYIVEISPAAGENKPVVESVKASDVVSETAAEPISVAVIEEANVSVVETPVVDEIMPLVEKDVVGSVSNGSFEKKEDCSEDKVGISAEFVDVVSKTKEEEFVIQSVENVAAVSDPKECVIQENDDRLIPSYDEITPLVEKDVVGSVSNGSYEKKEDCSEDKVGISAEFVDMVSKTKEEEFVIQSVENVAAVSDPKECVIQENDDRLIPSYDAEHVPANNGGEAEMDSVTQPLLEQPVEKSSWKSCCGLSELFGK